MSNYPWQWYEVDERIDVLNALADASWLRGDKQMHESLCRTVNLLCRVRRLRKGGGA